MYCSAVTSVSCYDKQQVRIDVGNRYGPIRALVTRSDPRFPRACINMSQEVEGHGIFKENPKLSGKWLE